MFNLTLVLSILKQLKFAFPSKESSFVLTPLRHLSSYDDGEENAAHLHMMICRLRQNACIEERCQKGKEDLSQASFKYTHFAVAGKLSNEDERRSLRHHHIMISDVEGLMIAIFKFYLCQCILLEHTLVPWRRAILCYCSAGQGLATCCSETGCGFLIFVLQLCLAKTFGFKKLIDSIKVKNGLEHHWLAPRLSGFKRLITKISFWL